MTRSFSYSFRFLFLGLFLSVSATGVMAQARLILNNGGFVNITQGAYVVIENPAANAITRNTSGNIIIQGVNSIVKWNIGTNTTAHIFPFGTGSGVYIPFTLQVTAGNIGNVAVSSYATAANNTPFPATVTNMNRYGADNSANVVDRFWQIDKDGPSGTATVTFAATPAEVGTITTLLAQRWNGTIWEDPLPGQVSTATGVTVTGITAFSPWTLSGNSAPLPVEMLSFTATPVKEAVDLNWKTALEIDNDYFTVQRSKNGLDFSDIAKVPAGAANKSIQKYTYVDSDPLSGKSYYRLKQTDLDGAYEFSEIRMVELEESQARVTAYPNPVTDNKFFLDFHHALETPTVVAVYDRMGRIIFSKIVNPGERTYTVNLNNPSTGVYVVKTTNSKSSFRQTIVVK